MFLIVFLLFIFYEYFFVTLIAIKQFNKELKKTNNNYFLINFYFDFFIIFIPLVVFLEFIVVFL